MEIIQAFGCSHCSMTSRLKSSVTRHERESCRKSPIRTTCGLCENMYIEEVEINQYETVDVHTCSEKGEIDHGLNVDMACQHFERKTI